MSNRYEFYLKGRPRLPKPYHLKGVGLPNVFLLNGVKIEDDPDHGTLITIDRLMDLQRTIALSIVAKRGALTGDELRFLRKEMECSQEDLAQKLRISPQTVANYEKGRTEAGPADMAVRYLYLAHTAPSQGLAEIMSEIAESAIGSSSTQKRKRYKPAGPWQEAERRAG